MNVRKSFIIIPQATVAKVATIAAAAAATATRQQHANFPAAMPSVYSYPQWQRQRLTIFYIISVITMMQPATLAIIRRIRLVIAVIVHVIVV